MPRKNTGTKKSATHVLYLVTAIPEGLSTAKAKPFTKKADAIRYMKRCEAEKRYTSVTLKTSK